MGMMNKTFPLIFKKKKAAVCKPSERQKEKPSKANGPACMKVDPRGQNYSELQDWPGWDVEFKGQRPTQKDNIGSDYRRH